MGTEVSFDGMESLLANLEKLGENASKVENEALRAGAKVLQAAIEKSAPRDPKSKEHAADHIAISKVKSQNAIKVIFVGVERTDNSRWFYLKFIEFGTSKMPARPFMDPAAKENKSAVIEAMAIVVKEGLKL